MIIIIGALNNNRNEKDIWRDLEIYEEIFQMPELDTYNKALEDENIALASRILDTIPLDRLSYFMNSVKYNKYFAEIRQDFMKNRKMGSKQEKNNN